MEGLLILLAFGLAVIPFVLPIVAMRRTRRIGALDARLGAVEQELIVVRAENVRLRAYVEELDARPAAPAPADAGLPPLEDQPTGLRAVPPAPEAAALAALDQLAEDARREASGLDSKVTVTDMGAVARTSAAPPPPVVQEEQEVDESSPTGPQHPVDAPDAVAQAVPSDPGPPPPAPEPKPAINWEQWLGVRGAAALGGIVLALAGILFFQYSIQHGLISPAMRVVIGTVVGVGCFVASARMRGYGIAANALGGAGAVILYACFWAARGLYHLIPMEAAFALMAITTATTAVMAARFGSLLIAALGLTGGFLTPLLLSTGANKPISLFGYLLVLDTGFLIVAFRRRWGGLALFALAGTLLLEALWIGAKMEPGQLAIGLGATGLFAVLFLASGARAPSDGPRPTAWLATQAAAVLLPHAFALYFVLDAHLGPHLYPVGILLVLLEIAALYVAGTRGADPRMAFLPTAGGAGTLAVVASWLGRDALTSARGWEAAGVAVALALPAVIVALRQRRPAVPALLYAGGLLVVLFTAAIGGNIHDPWPFVSALAVLTALLVAIGHLPGAELVTAIAPACLGAALALIPLAAGQRTGFPRAPLYLAAELALFVAAYALALSRAPRKDALSRRCAEGALLLGALALLGVAGWDRVLSQPVLFVALLPVGWGVLLVGAVVLRGDGRWLASAALPVLAVHAAMTDATLASDHRAEVVQLLACALAVALFCGAPFVRWPRLAGRAAFYVAALAGLAWLLPALALYRDRFGHVGQGGLALGFAVLTLAVVPGIRARFAADDPARRSALVWVAAAALGLLSIAIPLELDRQWITIGYALECGALLALWQRLDHPGLKYFALALATAVTARLCLNPSVLVYADRGSLRLLNWVLYTYWVPALALGVALAQLQPLELARLRGWELLVYAPAVPAGEDARAKARPLGVVLLGISVILIFFVWINLAIADWFGQGRELTLDFERKPARDLATSIAWALYAIVLLGLGAWKKSSALRWVSLGMLVITIGKVFLYDLGELKDLYRVVSLLGLAVSLIAVSLAYQRFVFRKVPAPTEKKA